MKYSFILLHCGKDDMDERVSTSAIASLKELVTATKQAELVQKLKNERIDFTCSTLQKVEEWGYTGSGIPLEQPEWQLCIQMPKSCLDILYFHPMLFDTKNEQILSLLKNNVLFDFVRTENSHVASSVLKLVRSNIDSLGFCLP